MAQIVLAVSIFRNQRLLELLVNQWVVVNSSWRWNKSSGFTWIDFCQSHWLGFIFGWRLDSSLGGVLWFLSLGKSFGCSILDWLLLLSSCNGCGVFGWFLLFDFSSGDLGVIFLLLGKHRKSLFLN